MHTKAEITDFPKQGDTLKVSLRNSNFPLFPVAYAKRIKRLYPEIWKLGGNIEGNTQFRRLYPIAENNGVADTKGQADAIRKREAWAARHYKDFRIAGTVAQMKWLVIGQKGLSHMKALINEEIDKRKKQNGDKMIFKNLICERVKTAKETTVSFVASNDSIDRMGDVIDVRGWSLDAYSKNPVILFNHDQRALPIGRGAAEIIDNQLMIDIQFDENDPEAKKIKSKVDGGFLNAVSVGFKPIKAIERNMLPKENKYYGEQGTYFAKAELMEVSIVTIPANPQATAAKSLQNDGIISALAEMVTKHIMQVAEDEGSYTITFAKAKEDEEHEEPIEEPVEPQEESNYYDDDDDKDKEKTYNLELIKALLA